MTEENPTPEQAPSKNEPPTGESDGTPKGGETPQAAPPPPPVTDEPPATSSEFDPPHAQEQTPPPPPASPAPWPPSERESSSSPEEDEALREQRARRFGGQEEARDPGGEDSAGPATQVFSPEQHEGEQVSAPGPAPVVTPIPAAPAGPAFADPAAQGPATGQHPSSTQGTFPPTTQMPAPPPAPVTAQEHDEFEGVQEGPVSRAAAHWWTVLITLVFAPVAWYLFTDGGARIQWAGSQGEPITIAAYIEFGLGLLAVFIFLLAARWSSVGAIIMGSLFFALGAAFLIFPGEGGNILMQSTEYFGRLGQFGINVVEHLGLTLETGRMVLYGFVMIMVGVVSHGARRQGRREERTKVALGE